MFDTGQLWWLACPSFSVGTRHTETPCLKVNTFINLRKDKLSRLENHSLISHEHTKREYESQSSQAAMKAVVATSRMHEGSRRRTDSCEIPGSDKNSRQSSITKYSQMDTQSESAPADEGTDKAEGKESDDQSAPADNPPSPKSSALPTRPPLKPEGLRQTTVMSMAPVVRPRVPKKSCSVDPGIKHDPMPVLSSPPSPTSIGNGFVETGNSTTECQWGQVNPKETRVIPSKLQTGMPNFHRTKVLIINVR